jgi:hypothetical protein
LTFDLRPSTFDRRLRRRGLAPIELVLAIPLLFMVVALSVIYGVVACWKVRAEVVARDQIWGHRVPRGEPFWGDMDPRALEWPQPAGVGFCPCENLVEADHQAFQAPLIRGPLPGGLAVNDWLFDPTRGVRGGRAVLSRDPPMLAKLGKYNLNVRQELLDNKWQYPQTGIGSNTTRRIQVIYPTLLDPAQAAGLRAQYQQAVQAVANSPLQPDLAVLDRDEEIREWYGWYRDFHPRYPGFCSLDADEVRQRYTPRHLPRVKGVPMSLTRFFLQMYRSQLAVLENSDPPGSPLAIAELKRKIEILEKYEQRLAMP